MNEKVINVLKDVGGYVLIILAVIVIRVFIFDPVRVDGPSMDTTLQDGEVLILNKVKYRKHDIERYDVVVVNDGDKKIIKRVIGLPNETIEIKNNKVYANGLELDNSFASTETNDFNLTDIGLKKIPADSYFVLGDNRRISHDSRYADIGTIKKDQIVGKATIVVWPIKKIGIVK